MAISSAKKLNLIPENNLDQVVLLMVFAAVMFFVRTVPVHHLIFTNWLGEYGNFVNFSADDAVYHMRLVHNTLHHYPWRVFFDPFTHFPFGDKIHFGPLFTLIIATAALIAGLGEPTPALVNLVGAYTPAVMGALCLIPVYFIARNLFGGKAAILCAFTLTFLPGEFLQRSTLGFTDHHVAEVLFSTTTCAFLIYSLNIANIQPTNYKRILNYGILTGIFFGLFVLTWPAALMFGAIFLIFFVSQLIVNNLKDKKNEYLLLLASVTYIIPAVMILPYALMQPRLDVGRYSLTQPLVLIVMLLIVAVCYLTHVLCKKNKVTKELYSAILAVVFFTIGYAIYLFAPKLFAVMKDGCKLLFEPAPGMKTVSEVRPSILDRSGTQYTITHFWLTYFWSLWFAIIGLGHLCYRCYKNINPAEILLLVWTIAAILAAIFQCRFNYYLAINVAILTGCYFIYPIIDFLSNHTLNHPWLLVLQKTCTATLLVAFMLVTVDPILMLIIDKNLPVGYNISAEHYHTLMWLKYHTPNPEGKVIDKSFDYAAGYYPIPTDTSLPYKYKDSAYGIMAWWDIGHQITYIAERIPNSNPFQLGVIEKNQALGAAPFFTSLNEEKALTNLNAMGSRYIVIENKDTIDLRTIGVWCNDIENWSTLKTTELNAADTPSKKLVLKLPIDSKKFSQAMISRLYYDDANGLEHFRLVHESNGDYIVVLRRAIFKPTFFTNTLVFSITDYARAVEYVNATNKTFWANEKKEVLAYHARPPAKRFKVFEKVRGAIISGKAASMANNTEINLSLQLKTKFNRPFTYQQTTKINNGTYQFIVPYPTTDMRGDHYFYDITPVGNYTILVNGKITEVAVPEAAVMLGKSISIDLQG